jgi:hypothetical protein
MGVSVRSSMRNVMFVPSLIIPFISCGCFQGVKAVKEEIDESSAYSRGRLYKPPGIITAFLFHRNIEFN